jgi:hypothetical protein
MSAFIYHLAPPCICRVTANSASAAEYPGLKPNEFGSNFASHSGSKARSKRYCRIRSLVVGIPKYLIVPSALGIGTLLKGEAFPSKIIFDLARFNLSVGSRKVFPSTPGVILPWLS